MESKKYKSTIKSLTAKPDKEFSGNTFKVTKVELSNGHSPDFWSNGEFPFKKGNVIEYTLDEKYNKGKLSYPHPKFEENMIDTSGNKISSSQMTQQESIARSVAWNNVSQFIFSEEFQKYNEDTDKEGKPVMLSQRQIKMLDQAIISADLIFKQLITKPK